MDIVSTGVGGLDQLLRGGVPRGSTIILEGTPGSGKTTLAFQFLWSGATLHGESGIYLTFEELPSQLYEDMKPFGWDLRELEKKNQLRVVCLSPETFLDQLLHPDGIFERMFDEIQCKRIIIDSVSLLSIGLADAHQQRKILYKLRNALRKKGLTALLIREQGEMNMDEVPFEHFVADGVIRLEVQKHHIRYRERVIEILKMRGRNYVEGAHVYRISSQGIYVVPSLFVTEPRAKNAELHTRTGVQKLDEVLSGGIPDGTVFMFDTDSAVAYKHLFSSIITERLKAGQKGIIMPSNFLSTQDLVKLYSLHGVSLIEQVDRNNLFIVDHYNRPNASQINTGIINVSQLDDQQFKDYLLEKLFGVILEGLKRGETWFAFYNMNTILSERGKQFATRYFAEIVSNARAYGITLIAVCNFKEVDAEIAAFLERTSDGVIRTWVETTYQYLQVSKSPEGKRSEIFILEHIDEKPYLRLI